MRKGWAVLAGMLVIGTVPVAAATPTSSEAASYLAVLVAGSQQLAQVEGELRSLSATTTTAQFNALVATANADLQATQAAMNGVSKRIAEAPRTFFTLSGEGSTATERFTATAPWSIAWVYTCPNFVNDFGPGIEIDITGYGAADFDNETDISRSSPSGQGISHYYDLGTFNLDLDNFNADDCPWKVTVSQS